jgi:casein kinase 1
MSQLTEKYFVISTIGHGSFGEVYMAHYIKNDKKVALKVENKKTNMQRLSYEYSIYKKISQTNTFNCIPKIFEFLQTTDYNILSMELLGTSLEDIFNRFHKKFKISTVVFLGLNIINILENVHNSSVMHRDIKPAKLLIRIENKSNIYLTDFGLSKVYMNKNKHIPHSFGHTIIGTARYSSINMHMGIEPSRRDDLESIGYMLVYFAKGRLPWQGIRGKDKFELFDKIGNVKMSTNFQVLTEDLPDCFYKYLTYCRSLKFTDPPDYDHLKKLFIGSIHQYHMQCQYEWISME